MATDPLIDSLFDGRYRILRKLGAGGMANVYLAEDQELGRRVAIKILNDRHANDEQFVERFRREAKNAAALSHPNIVSIYDRGEAEGTYYIAMEYLDGRSLKELILSRGPAPVNVAVEYARQILSALRFAHRHGIVHRDIKPHNVLVDNEGRVKVTDFGIARAGTSQMTEAGSIVGTAQYLSPEQARGTDVDPRSDLYSLGVVLYELLTGETPFEGDTPVEIAMKHLSTTPEPPSSHRPDIPRELDWVVMRALAKDPDERYQSADEMDADLERVARGAPVAAQTEESATQIIRRPAVVPPVAAASTAATMIAPRPAATRTTEFFEYDEPPRQRPVWPWIAAVLGVIVAAAAGFLIYHELKGNGKPVVGVELYVNESQNTAVQQIQAIHLNANVQKAPSDNTQKGLVFKQNPKAGTRVHEGSTVTIWVSTGKPKVQIPQGLVGQQVDQVTNQLTQLGFQVKTFTVPGNQKGVVTAVVPKEGTSAVKGSTVQVNVQSGPKPVTVPKVVGEQLNQATNDLQSLGFKVNPKFVDSNAPQNQVVSQSVSPGSTAPQGGTITIEVSNGPPQVSVPSVVGEDQGTATSDLQGAGFKVSSQTQQVTDPAQDGVVVSQNPSGGQAAKGSTVTIVVGQLSSGTTTTTPGQ
ncbi:MAG: Stk1 family PASTA domain-containing Ser/Thr kinase [Actinobacteria bacterium]|nr:Stk1 family PASTA domain-containing Ser/Thr kinase [Actinomycetota bacterium]MBV8563161.1 Stk1 family PASTA domain-containing Ser/Thr kinase [Actinomycetota bacterium]